MNISCLSCILLPSSKLTTAVIYLSRGQPASAFTNASFICFATQSKSSLLQPPKRESSLPQSTPNRSSSSLPDGHQFSSAQHAVHSCLVGISKSIKFTVRWPPPFPSPHQQSDPSINNKHTTINKPSPLFSPLHHLAVLVYIQQIFNFVIRWSPLFPSPAGCVKCIRLLTDHQRQAVITVTV